MNIPQMNLAGLQGARFLLSCMHTEQLGFYGRLARWVMHHRGVTVAVIALITLVSGFFTTHLRINSDILALMPQDDPSTIALAKIDNADPFRAREGRVQLPVNMQDIEVRMTVAPVAGGDARASRG